MKGEAGFIKSFIDQYKNPLTRGQLGPEVQKFNAEDEAALFNSPNVVHALGATLLQPDAQFNAWWSGVQTQVAGSPVAVQMLSNLSAIRTRGRQDLTQRIMAASGLALLNNSQQQFTSLLDPGTGQPFAYTATPSGFQLSSPTLLSNKKPLSLSFSTPRP